MRDVLRRAEPPERNAASQQLARCASGKCARHVGVDEARRHAIHRDVAAADFLRQRLGEADERRLGGGVVGLARVARSTPTTEPIWMMRPAPRLHHAAQHRLGQAECRLQVGGHDRIPVSSFMRSSRLSRVMPALLTRIVIAPKPRLDRRRAPHRRQPRRSRRAACRRRGRRPPPDTRRSTRRRSSVVAVPITVAPSRASASAIARPMPRVAPVTSAIFAVQCARCHRHPPFARRSAQRRPARLDAASRRAQSAVERRRRCAAPAPPAPCPARIRRRA